MGNKRVLVIFLIFLLMGVNSCCHKSRIILLDSGRAGNAIVVSTEKSQQVLDKPYTYTEVVSAKTRPSAPAPIDPLELEKQYGALIHAAPRHPVSFLLYFKSGSLDLVDASKKMLPEIKETIKKRQPCDIGIIGHSDRAGSREYNYKLSLIRARKVFKLLQEAGLKLKNVTVESYGEDDPLIPTPDGVSEPRNRRVEILIR